MTLRLVEDTDIKITKAICSQFDGGFCYSSNNPYYSGHYETAEQALEAAKRKKEKDGR